MINHHQWEATYLHLKFNSRFVYNCLWIVIVFGRSWIGLSWLVSFQTKRLLILRLIVPSMMHWIELNLNYGKWWILRDLNQRIIVRFILMVCLIRGGCWATAPGASARRRARVRTVSLARLLLRRLGVQVAVIFLTARYIFGLITLQRVNIEHGAQRAAVWSSHALNANIELATVGGVGVSGVVARLVDLRGVGANEAVAHLALVASVHQIGPNANTLLVIVS